MTGIQKIIVLFFLCGVKNLKLTLLQHYSPEVINKCGGFIVSKIKLSSI